MNVLDMEGLNDLDMYGIKIRGYKKGRRERERERKRGVNVSTIYKKYLWALKISTYAWAIMIIPYGVVCNIDLHSVAL